MRDGTAERDYLHVLDLLKPRIIAEAALLRLDGHEAISIGNKRGVTVREMVKVFETACSCSINTNKLARRAGDPPSYFANSDHALKLLARKAELSLTKTCHDTWNWQQKSPNGFKQ